MDKPRAIAAVTAKQRRCGGPATRLTDHIARSSLGQVDECHAVCNDIKNNVAI